MGTISDKLTYLNTTKSQLKDMINYGLPTEEQITSNTTFRNYVTSIFNAFLEALRNPDTLFTNLPKKSGSGSVISLNDTANAPMRIELGATELTQSGTPTPSSPQDIHTISGSNTIKVEGSNFFIPMPNGTITGTTETSTYIATIKQKFNYTRELTFNNGEISGYPKNGNGSYYIWEISYKNLKPSTTYTIAFNYDFTNLTGTTGNLIIHNYVVVPESGITSVNGKGLKTFTTNASGEYSVQLFNIAEACCNSSTFMKITNIQLNEGSYTLSTIPTYTPYISQEADIDLDTIEYCKIGNYEDKFIRTSGNNLFDGNYKHLALWSTSAGASTTFAGNNNNYIGAYVKVESGKTYSLSREIETNRFAVAFSVNEPVVDGACTVYNTGTGKKIENITIPDGYNYLFVYLSNSGESTSNINLMINEGSTSLSYEPYGSNEWYIKKDTGLAILNGSETWIYADGSATISAIITDDVKNIKLGSSSLSNYFVSTAGDNRLYAHPSTQNRIILSIENSIVGIESGDSNVTKRTKIQTWLSSHHTSFYYQLETPTYTQITGTLAEQLEYVYQKLLSYTGQTNISQVNNDLSFNLSVQAIEG